MLRGREFRLFGGRGERTVYVLLRIHDGDGLDDQGRKCMVIVLRRCGGFRYQWWRVIVVEFLAT